ncbi:uncharacterized protein LOC141858768 [Brevipalpus obovatus]|uniref:uncharacterized protein LOC141858768 n=1 Tax=Brevipalpus obovatus TaxID=246614 RepID=UPI003D9DC6DE
MVASLCKALQSALIISLVREIRCKGTGMISASQQGSGEVCSECGGYTDAEMETSLMILMMIMGVFLTILCCQCLSRILHACNNNNVDEFPYEKYKTLPPPPYMRTVQGV